MTTNTTYSAACDEVAKIITENPALIHAPKLTHAELLAMPSVKIDVPASRPDVVELEVANAYSIRDRLRASGYSWNGVGKTWYVFIEPAELGLWLEELRELNVRTGNCACMSPSAFEAVKNAK